MRTVADRQQSNRNGKSAAVPHFQGGARAEDQRVQLSQTPCAIGKGSSPPARPRLGRSGAAGIAGRLEGMRILVVEDEFLLADEIVDWLVLHGAEPLGPAATLPQALDLIEQNTDVDGAVLDINLAGTMVFPLALELKRRGVPLLFASAYAEDVVLPDELKGTLRVKKPFSEAQLIKAVELALDAGG